MTVQNIVSVPMSVDLEAQVKRAAARQGISLSALIRRAVINFLEVK